MSVTPTRQRGRNEAKADTTSQPTNQNPTKQVRACRAVGKPVIVATEMLESMQVRGCTVKERRGHPSTGGGHAYIGTYPPNKI